MKYRCEYKYAKPYTRKEHQWIVEGPRMGVHLHISDAGEDEKCVRYHGGIELHYRTPPDHMAEKLPIHNCHVLGGVCWHDGSSLQVSDYWIPMWRESPDDHERMFKMLIADIEEREGRNEKPTVTETVHAISEERR